MTVSVKNPISVYIHIPFCVSKCHYCDFNSIGMGKSPIPENSYIEDLARELGRWTEVLNPKFSFAARTVFFGGGTPSMFSAAGLGEVLSDLRHKIPLEADVEISLEMNPKTADRLKMKELRQAGIQRLSIGVQTLEEGLLKSLARAHTAQDALRTLQWAFESGFERVNIDLMYGLPNQTRSHLESTLAELRDFPLRHLSAYELIVEPETPFYDRYLQGNLALPDSEGVLAMREQIERFAALKGMHPYEVSNYASLGQESRHNRHYWNYDSFLGLGAGAVSFLRKEELSEAAQVHWDLAAHESLYGIRFMNPRDLADYSKQGGPLFGAAVEPIDIKVAMGEFLMVGLRKTAGVSFADFEEKFARPLPDSFKSTIQAAKQKGWMESDSRSCRFTPQGMLMSNEVLQNFL